MQKAPSSGIITNEYLDSTQLSDFLNRQDPEAKITLICPFSTSAGGDFGIPDFSNKTKITIASLLKNRHLTLGILAQFCNVGAQVSLWGNFVDLKIDLASETNLWIVQKIYQTF